MSTGFGHTRVCEFLLQRGAEIESLDKVMCSSAVNYCLAIQALAILGWLHTFLNGCLLWADGCAETAASMEL